MAGEVNDLRLRRHAFEQLDCARVVAVVEVYKRVVQNEQRNFAAVEHLRQGNAEAQQRKFPYPARICRKTVRLTVFDYRNGKVSVQHHAIVAAACGV